MLTWKWFSSILPQFLGCLGFLVPGVCACGLLSVVLYTRIGVVLLSPCALLRFPVNQYIYIYI